MSFGAMNSKGRGISQEQRVANLPLRVGDAHNPYNATRVLDSLTLQPKAPMITNYGVGNPQIHRGYMNSVNYSIQYEHYLAMVRATHVAPIRMKNILSNPNMGTTAIFSKPNDYNHSLTSTRGVGSANVNFETQINAPPSRPYASKLVA
jgi:hypothetical protein